MPEITIPEFPEIRFFLGGCVARGDGSSFRASAHAHNQSKYPNYGWVCIRGKMNKVRWPNGELTRLMLHEVAHMLVPEQGHTRRFYEQFVALGGRIDDIDRRHAPKATQGM